MTFMRVHRDQTRGSRRTRRTICTIRVHEDQTERSLRTRKTMRFMREMRTRLGVQGEPGAP